MENLKDKAIEASVSIMIRSQIASINNKID